MNQIKMDSLFLGLNYFNDAEQKSQLTHSFLSQDKIAATELQK